MVRSLHLRLMVDRSQLPLHLLIDHEIIQTPPNILSSNAWPITPPGVVTRILHEAAKGIHVTLTDESVHPGSFLRKKTGIILIRLWVFQINFLMGDIEISTKDHVSTLSFQVIAELQHFFAERQLVRQAGVISLTVLENRH